MKSRILLIFSILIALSVGLAGGRSLALFSEVTTPVESTFTAARISVVCWRDQGDKVPQPVQWTGWPAPMFYTTEEEGAYP